MCSRQDLDKQSLYSSILLNFDDGKLAYPACMVKLEVLKWQESLNLLADAVKIGQAS